MRETRYPGALLLVAALMTTVLMGCRQSGAPDTDSVAGLGEVAIPSASPATNAAFTTNSAFASNSAYATNPVFATNFVPNWNMKDKVVKTEAEWKQQLTPDQFRVLRKEGTERAFTGHLWDQHEPGVYRCAGCGLELFTSETKFDSGTGWPSFWQPIRPEHVGSKADRKLFVTRTEVHCARCDGHLGHVFDDGPAPTGKRFCINSAALSFEQRKR